MKNRQGIIWRGLWGRGILEGMETVYQLKPNELTDEFFNTIKKLFGNKEIKITIEENPQEEEKKEHWARIGKIAEENPDLPYAFIEDILKAKAEIDSGETSILEFRHE